MSANPENRIPDARKDALIEAAQRRYSCRRMTAALTGEDQAALGYLAGKCALTGVRIGLLPVDDSLFVGLPTVGKITGCRLAAVLSAKIAQPHCRLLAGFSGEYFTLEAETLGIRSCWLTGTYHRKQVQAAVPSDELLIGIIALGRAEAPAALQRRRKPLAKICEGDVTVWPEEFRRAAELVQIAPSAINLQPWRMSAAREAFVLDGSGRSPIDVGIAMCHAELALRRPHVWRLMDDRPGEPMTRAEFVRIRA